MPQFCTAIIVASRQLKKALWRGRAPSSSTSRQAQSTTLKEENLSLYSTGGYHPVRLGDVFDNGAYKVLRKLGYGVYSTVWLAHDTKTKQQVALKILTADSYGGIKDTYELAILEHITEQARNNPLGGQHVLVLLKQFRHCGPNGEHVCLVFKPMGPDLGKLRDIFPRRRLPIPVAKKVARDLVSALVFLHDSCGIIHTDIKPSNILVETQELNDIFQNARPEVFEQETLTMPPPHDYYVASAPVVSAFEDLETSQDMSFRLADFGTSSWTHDHLTEWIQPNMLRAPEVILGAEWDTKVDIWNLGLVIWELATGQLCFDGQATATAEYSSEAHLAQMQAILGQFPETLLSRSPKRDRFFDAKGNRTSDISFPSFEFESMCTGSGAFTGRDDMPAFLDFVQSTLALEPHKRPTAQDLLNAPWIKDD
ncbi:hypothetical protein SBRCBS47491_004411 [Sporothrix bragantina]|uniref:non-specific serine/threonine protein kinase n=1 Tax=Sporothrix bragantina TaxID=671064 RepID=A0ABP0BN83_9PEZI